MPKRRKAKSKTKAKSADSHSLWESLTWDDLSAWAGARSVKRGRSYQRQGRVEELVESDEGRLLASVSGRQGYVTSVWCGADSSREHPVQSTCTCPVGYDGCKHAVAVVAEYLKRLAEGEDVPMADADDPRWLEFESGDAERDDEFVEEWNDFPYRRKLRAAAESSGRERADWDRKIAEHIRAKSREELSELVISLTKRFPELRQEFQERIALSEGDVDRLVKQARKQMREQTSEIGWRDHWRGEGHTPDYSGFRHRLERLVELGHPDAVVELGREFIRRGIDQVGQSHDDGWTGMAVAECLPVIFTAVAQSSLPGPEQLQFAIDACLEDDYGLIDDAADPVLNGDWTAADWSEVADRLQRRLDDPAASGGESQNPFLRDYHRDGISGWLVHALENAGRAGEIRRIYEAEARRTRSYERLVRYLLDQGEIDDACRWAEEGIEQTRQQWPGIASKLAEMLCEVARSRKQWDVVAAHVASDFFERPSAQGFDELVKAARKAKCLQKVKAAALKFLETGELPIRRRPEGKGKNRTFRIEPTPEWPLPLPKSLALLLKTDWAARPYFNVLLEMAIADKNPDDVLHWYDQLAKGSRMSAGRFGDGLYGSSYADRVATAVAKSHPERALEIYTDGLNASLGPANPNAYERAAEYLKRMRPLLKSLGRETEWNELIEQLRGEYKRRRLFMEALDRVDGRTIVQSRKKQRQR